jgi:diguanylate cyclase (GGDEF)-like protein/PAS domain S-box-containing protein
MHRDLSPQSVQNEIQEKIQKQRQSALCEAGQGDILIVGDASPALASLTKLFGGAGYCVQQAASAGQALSAAAWCVPELILLDIRIQTGDNIDVCARLKGVPELRDVPVIFLSRQAVSEEDQLRSFAAGGVDFIVGPWLDAIVLARARVHLRQGRAQRVMALQRDALLQRAGQASAEREQLADELALEVQRRGANEGCLLLADHVFEATLDAIAITDADGLIIASNPAFSRITCYMKHEVLGQEVMRFGADRNDRVFKAMRHALAMSGLWSGEVQSRRKSGATYPSLLSVSTRYGEDGKALNFIVVLMDLSERKAEQHLIDFLSHYDALTGLPNRERMRERFDLQLDEARRDRQVLVVMCLNLDRFKSINDSFGSQVGDKALQVVARFLVSCLSETDTVARQGGDEFQIILQDDGHCGATLAMVQKILDGLRDELVIDGRHIALTTSIGIAVFPNDGNGLDELLRNADTALCRAKETGRDTYAFFTERMDIDIRAKLAIQTELRGAILRNEFEVHYQPQVCLNSGALMGAEALLRWNNVNLGLISPKRFIPLAEEFGMIDAISVWVLETVCAQIRTWQDDGLEQIKVSVNLSGSQFALESTAQLVENTLARNRIAASCLGLEITEGTVMKDPEQATIVLQRLKAIGVGVSLDDFGTGYSSLSYLKRFPIDALKIDKSFVDDVTTDTDDAAIALSVISLAHNLDMRVIAEGVETREQAAFLAAHGCDEMQGYLFSRPIPATAFGALWRKHQA